LLAIYVLHIPDIQNNLIHIYYKKNRLYSGVNLKSRILIVEDESIEAMNFEQSLTSFGYDVIGIASTGKDALKKVAEFRPDLVLMDIVLKGDMDGIEAAAQIKEDFEIPVVYLTAHPEESAVNRAKLTSPYGYLIKPVSKTDLNNTIELALYKHEMESKLKMSEERNRLLVENAGLGIGYYDLDGRILMFNKIAARNLNGEPDDFVGKTLYDLFDRESASLYMERLEKALNSKESQVYEDYIPFLSDKWFLSTFTRIEDHKGNIVGVQVISNDITDRKKADEELLISEKRYRDLFNHMDSGVAVYQAVDNGEDFVFTDFNPAAEHIDHLRKEDVIGKRVTEVFPGVKDFGIFKVFQIVRKTGKPEYFPENIYQDDKHPGSWRENWVYKLPTGEIVAIYNDITPRKQLEEELFFKKKVLEAQLESTVEGVLVVDDKGKVILYNKRFGEILDIPQSILDLMDDKKLIKYVLNDLKDPESFIKKIEYLYTHKNEKSRDRFEFKNGKIFDRYSSPLLDKSGHYYGRIWYFQDITKRKKAYFALQKSERRFRAVAESATDAIVTTNVDGKILFCNKSMSTIFGYHCNELIGKNLTILMPDRFKDNYIKGIENFKISGDHGRIGKTLKTVGLKKDGTEFPFEMSLATWKSNKKTFFTSIIRDFTEREKAEKELEAASKYNRSLIEASLDPLVTIGADGKITDVNSATEQVTGCSRHEIISTDFSDYFTEPEKARNGYQQVFKKGFVRDYPLKIKNKKGKIIPVLYNASVYQNESGEVVGVFAAARDITERENAEKKLELASKYNRNLIESSVDPLVTIGSDGRITDVNKSTEAVTGYPREELTGTDFSKYFTEPEKARKGYKKAFQEGKVKDYRLDIQHKNGNINPVLYNASVYKDANGKVIGVFAAARDITELIKTEKALKESEEKYRTLFESDPDYTILVGLDGVILDVNAAAEDLVGESKDEFVGKHFTELTIFPKEELDKHGEMYSRLLKGEYIAPYESKVYNRKGEIHWVKTIVTIMKNGKNPNYILIINNDITSRKKAEDKIKASLREKEVLLKEIHHRVKNNLQIISSLLDLQQDYVRDDLTAVNVLKESQNRVLSMAMLHEILYQSENLNQIDFSAYIKNLVSNLFSSYGVKADIQAEITVEEIFLNIETSIPLGLIITELVSNSLKYAFPGEETGKLIISLDSHDKEFELNISDNGIGFPEEIDFKKTESTLGLKLVNTLVNQIDGTIELKRTKGTQYIITFKELTYNKRF
jgi:PAS domain S-box-containing protein